MAIRGEQTGTQELRRDGLFLWASLLSDPATAHLAKPVRQAADNLMTSEQATRAAEKAEIEKWAHLQRAEFEHDDLQRECELDVFKAVKKNRKADGYRSVYPSGLSDLIQRTGKEQQLAVEGMLKGLEAHHPELGKRYKKELTELSRKATQAEQEWEAAESRAAQAFQAERLARARLVRTMQRTAGALLTLFPGDWSRVRSYFRDRRRTRDDAPAVTPAPPPEA